MRAWAGLLTSEGRGAVAVVRVWGPDAVAIADAVFRPARGRGLAGTPAGRLRFGRVGDGLGDEVVAVVLGGASPEVEIQCHGGPAAVGLVVEALVARGARVETSDEWAARAYSSRLKAEAAIDLARAPTVRTAEILLDQADGALDRELSAVESLLRDDPPAALAGLDALIGRAAMGLRLVEGWRVVLAGRPNVGKSRLLNALVGFDRAIVDPTPGTTRDVVTARAAVAGWPIELADTAGLRPAEDAIEAAGLARARNQQAGADLVVLVLERSAPLGPDDLGLVEAWPGALVVANKSDLTGAWDAGARGLLAVSAERGDGIEALVEAIAGRLVLVPPPAGSGVPFRSRQVRRLGGARRLLAGGRVEGATRALGWLMRSR